MLISFVGSQIWVSAVVSFTEYNWHIQTDSILTVVAILELSKNLSVEDIKRHILKVFKLKFLQQEKTLFQVLIRIYFSYYK